MKPLLSSRLLAFAFAALVLAGCDQATAPLAVDDLQTAPTLQAGDAIPGQYIVVLDDALAGKTVRETLDEMTTMPGVQAGHTYTAALKGFAASLSPEAANALRQDDRVNYIEPDRVVTLPPFTIKGKPCWVTNTCGGGGLQTTPWGITRIGGATPSTGTAWVLDTGVDLDHPDLNVDAARSTTVFTKGKDSKDADDGHGHGTHVAGTIAALDNDRDVIGVAAGATIVAVKVLNSQGSGSYSGVIEGIDYVAANASSGDVANMSLGGPVSQAVDDAVKNAAATGLLFALAAGNESDDARNYSPARAGEGEANIYTVSAIDQNDCLASFSNYGPAVDVAAPGVGVLSTYKDGGTATLSGTSMASPHVAGLLLIGLGADGNVSCGDGDGIAEPIAHK